MPWRRRRPSHDNTSSGSFRTETGPVEYSGRVAAANRARLRHCRPDPACALAVHLVPARLRDTPRKALCHNMTRDADNGDYVN